VATIEEIRPALRVADPLLWVEATARSLAAAGLWPPPPEQRLLEGMLDAFCAGGTVHNYGHGGAKEREREAAACTGKVRYDASRGLWTNDAPRATRLTASSFNALAFADGVRRGKYGGEAVPRLSVSCWNLLVKACCYDGAVWRALNMLRVEMPAEGVAPDRYTYNTILSALSRTGDTARSNKLLVEMTNNDVPVDKFTVEALALCHLNANDPAGAATTVQDLFNQHTALPPYPVHLRVLTAALAAGDVHEARRHAHFVRHQLGDWVPSKYVAPSVRKLVYLTRRNPELSEGALRKLFRAHGEELDGVSGGVAARDAGT